ncbi:MAG: VWA domain-containing protein [bacterium]|nr:VWA domain-containing protein [bacterium]
MKTLSKVLVLALAAGGFWVPSAADDSDIFLVDAVEPNVVILLDSSGSMNSSIDGERKIASAQRVVENLINNIDGVRIGVFRFNGSSDSGMIVAPVGQDDATMVTLVNSISPNGMTPLGRATQTVQDYYMGIHSGRTCVGNCDGIYTPAGGDDDDDSSDDDDDGGEIWSTLTNYPSPIQYECQKNYAILVTDGMPNGEAETLVTDVAASLYLSDHSALPGTQNVITHTVGFDVPAGTALLTSTASAGGGSFFTASNAAQLEKALQDALSAIISDAYTFSAPLIPSTSVSGGGKAYLGSFEPDPVSPFWPGHLKAYTRSADGTIPLEADGSPAASALAWDAGQVLAARSAASRTIYTAAAGARQPFTTANAAITSGLLSVADNATKDKVIGFVRGVDTFDADADGNVTEQRDWKLGDVFHSAPVLVFPPPLASQDAAYDTFKSSNSSRTNIVLVGANDGMLHAFRASDGVELWGFIPPDLLDDLQDMTGRIGSHPYYVDGDPVVADVKTGGSWKTLALVGLRRGGASYLALNITDTTNPGYLWSFSDAELGESWSTPRIGKVKMSGGSTKYVAFFGAGYNTTANNASGRALLVVDLATGSKLWEYKAGATTDKKYMHFSIPASPTIVDLDQDGFIDRAYIGDVGGQLWKFDVSAEATVSGGLVTNWTGKRLFAAAPSAANPPASGEFFAPQAFYGSPTLALDVADNLWVFAGTGDKNHPKATGSNRFFAIMDDTDMTNSSALTSASLVSTSSGSAVTQGWYHPLASNEKVFDRADAFNGNVLFTTYTPESVKLCAASIGSAKLYALRFGDGLPGVDWTNGESLESPDGSEADSTDAGEGIASDPDVILGDTTDTIVVGSSEGKLKEIDLPAAKTKQIRYWREVF